MADQKISQLTEVTNPNPNDVIPIVNGSETKKITVANLAVAGSSGTSGSNGSSVQVVIMDQVVRRDRTVLQEQVGKMVQVELQV